MPLSTDQQHATDVFLSFLFDDRETEMAISGPGGTGKSYLTKHLIESAYKQIKFLDFLTESGNRNKLSIHLTATTNKAARVLSFLTDKDEAGTIHSLLGLKVFNDYKTGKVVLNKTKSSQVIYDSIIFIDEASMVDQQLLKLIREQTFKCKLIFIGDSYQLAPVKETTCPVFKDVKNQVKLTTIQRQAADNPIIQLGSGFRHALDTSVFPAIASAGDAIQVVSGPEFKEFVNTYFDGHNTDHSTKLIAWTNERVHQYNDYVRSLYTNNPAYEVGEYVVTNKPILVPGGAPYASTEAILEVTGIYPSKRGDIEGWYVELGGDVSVFQPANQKEITALIKAYARAKDWPNYFEAKDFFADLRPIHSCTAHKSQGSTYNTAMIDVTDIARNGKMDEIARMMYVAVTRASDNIILTGQLPPRFYI